MREADDPLDAARALARIDSILDGMSEGLVILDRDFRVLAINARGMRLEKRPASDIVGKTHWEAWPGSKDSPLGQLYKKAMTERVPVALAHSYTWAYGHKAWLEMRALPTDEGLAIFYRDVSETERAQAQLRETRAHAQSAAAGQATVLRQLAEGVIVTDAEGRITIVNQAAADIHGVARLDIAPNDYSASYHLFTEDGRPHAPHDLPLARAVRGETVKDARWRIRRPDGVDVLAIGTAQPLLGPTGHQVGAVLTLRDDTAREAAERSLRDLNESLERRVKDRTLELATAQQQADEARKQAEAANLAKSEFLASMSHEIRTPLHGVLGLADLLSDSDLSADQRNKVEQLKAAGAALLTVVNDILDFSKIEAGRIDLDLKPFSPKSLADNATSIVRQLAAGKGLILSAEIDTALPAYLQGDEGRLRQVLLNLLNNAIKFTPSGSVMLKIERIDAGHDACGLRFSVADTGIGIPKDKTHRLFERFTQIDSSLQRQYDGTGLGLAISKRLVELMGGEIGVVSEPGLGTTFAFTLTLPVATLPAPVDPAPETFGDPKRPGASILVVDDVELNLEIVRALLEKAGHRIETVSNGASAIAAVQTKAYDLVFMDVQMPGMDGLSATREIRALKSAAAHIPIIAMTANVLPHQVKEVIAAGMSDHVGKPFERAELQAAIAKWRR